MSQLQYYAYKGVGERNRDAFWYSQAVKIGDRIECAGQGGWDPITGDISPDVDRQIDQAFANVELNLRDAGAEGWSQVYSIKSYHIPLDDAAMDAMSRNMKKYLPNHKPIWTVLGVAALGEKEMKVEIDVVAVCK